MMTSDQPLTLEDLRIGNGNQFSCQKCLGILDRDQFEGDSIYCRKCVPLVLSTLHAEVTGEDVRKSKFELARQQMQDTATPAIPEGVQKARDILGKTSTELVAEMLYEIRNGQKPDGTKTFLPQDPKLFKQGLELLQRAEKQHDEFLRRLPPPPGVTYEEAQAIAIDTFIGEVTRDSALRLKVLRILYDRVPSLIDELTQVAQVTVIHQDASLEGSSVI